jgi:CBS domain-containing protein
MVGLGFGVLLGLVGIVVVFAGLSGALSGSTASNGAWVIFIGMFLFAAALASRRQAALRQSLATLPVRDLMVRTVTSIPENCPLDEAVNHYFRPYGYGGFPVLKEGQLVGLVTVLEIQNVPTTLWPWRRVGQVMRPLSPSLVVTPDVPVIQAMEHMAREGWDRLVVAEDGQVVGLVTHSAILHFLQLRSSVSPY